MICIASAVLLEALITNDFSIEYVWGTSSTDMPLFFIVTSFWGGFEGSLLFWVLIQSFFIMIVAFRYQYTNREIIPYVLATLNGIMTFLLILLLGWSNPLLQHFAMAMHPPTLYLGFIGFSITFAFAMGELI